MKPRLGLLMSLVGLFGCNGDSCGGVEPPVDVLLESGAYAAPAPYTDALGFFPHAAGGNFSLVIDKEGGRVTVQYEREGQIVEEVWRITAQEVGFHF